MNREQSIPCRIHFDIEIDRASSHVKIATPVGKALLFHDNLMAPASKGQSRGCVSNECTVNFNIRPRGGRLNYQRTRRWGRSRRAGRRTSQGSGLEPRGATELRHVEAHIPLYESRHLGTLGNRDVLAMHEEEQRSGWKEDNGCSNHSPGHRTHVPAALYVTARNAAFS